MEEKIFTPRRIIGIIFLIILVILYQKMNDFGKGYNGYPEDTAVLEGDFGTERDNYVKTFFDLIADNKYEEAYSMLDEKSKIDTFATLEGFSKYFKEHILDNEKIKKEVDIQWLNSDINTKDNYMRNYYKINISIKPEEFAKVNVTFDEILNFYDGRSFNITVIQTKPYEYKIYMLKPDIPFNQAELEEYINKNQ